jgi:magnesium transporter
LESSESRLENSLPSCSDVPAGKNAGGKAKITIIDYDAGHFETIEAKTVEEYLAFKDKPSVTWINIAGLGQQDVITEVGKLFKIHPLAMEDILNTYHRPKIEIYPDYLFVILKQLSYSQETFNLKKSQFSIVWGKNFVLTFQEQESEIFNPIKKLLKNDEGQLRKLGADYLVYALIEIIVDNYYVILDQGGEKLELLEEILIKNPTLKNSQTIHDLKMELLFLRKSVWPLREILSTLSKESLDLVSDNTRIYFRDVYDNVVQIIEMIEALREMASDMMDIYLSSINNKLSEVMKVLTIISTIFIPLTFIAGVYGMNFRFMPELEWRAGDFLVLTLMGLVAATMLLYFKRKKWY